MWPNRLALGAATGMAAAAMIAAATGWAGARTATVSSPTVTARGTPGWRGSTRVRGPGQNASTRARAAAGRVPATTRSSMAEPATWTIRGSLAGRPLAAKTRSIATSSNASHPRP